MPHYIKCDYCGAYQIQSQITKEHVMPQAYGGIVTIPVCEPCNQMRGISMTYPPFVQWKQREPALWASAQATAQMTRRQAKAKAAALRGSLAPPSGAAKKAKKAAKKKARRARAAAKKAKAAAKAAAKKAKKAAKKAKVNYGGIK